MINLLPPKNKEQLLQEENQKVAMILGINLLASFICFSLILYSINIFISGEIDSRKIIYEQKEEELRSPQRQSLEQGLISFNQTFKRLDFFYQNRIEAAELFEEFLEIIPPEIHLTSLSLNIKSADGRILECALAGFSPNRESLLKFKENLEEKIIFEEVYFPPASWIKSTDINFQATFRINPARTE